MGESYKDLGSTPYIRVKTLMARLRAPDGCPWDQQQGFTDIARYTIEEAYEVADAIAQNNMPHLREELGDLLLQVVFHSRIAEEAGEFTLDDVTDDLVKKMVRRHPHVFGDEADRTAAAQTEAWEDLKARERAEKGGSGKSLLDDVALALPALMRAEKLQKRAARVGFDWPSLDGVIDKITEEAQELAEAAQSQDPDAIEDEMGDLIFAVTNLARKLGVDPEVALRRTNDKFTRRFKAVEAGAAAQSLSLSDMSLTQMDALWDAAKAEERQGRPQKKPQEHKDKS